ncbi:MAG: hypothetical protein WAO58_08100 [Fimbriimonadaceae bacterium]
MSLSSFQQQGNGVSEYPSISANGRYIAFESQADNLVQGDTNGVDDIFVHDRYTGQTTLVSVSSNGQVGNGESVEPSISPDGRYVAFSSVANNLVDADSNGSRDVFVHDRQAGMTSRVSVSTTGEQGNDDSIDPSVSANGRYVAFGSKANNLVSGDPYYWDIFVKDRQTGITTIVSVSSTGERGQNHSWQPKITPDGRHVTFWSWSNMLDPEHPGGGAQPIYIHDRQTAKTSLVSISSTGQHGNNFSSSPSTSDDGRFVAFDSSANNLVEGDSNGTSDIFLRDRQTGQTKRVSVSSGGEQANQASYFTSISGDGRYIAFTSKASNLVQGDTTLYDVFVHDQETGQTTIVSVSSTGQRGNNYSGYVTPSSISGDGRFVAFESWSRSLVQGDTNNLSDVFMHQYLAKPPLGKSPPR